MSDRLSREEVQKVANLARLELTDEEVEHLVGELSAVLEHVAAIQRLDTAGLAPTSHAFALTNVLRADVVVRSLSRDEVLAEAPAVEDRRFKVPRILGEAP